MEGIKSAKRGTPVKVVHGHDTGKTGVLWSRHIPEGRYDTVVRVKLANGVMRTYGNGWIQPYNPRVKKV